MSVVATLTAVPLVALEAVVEPSIPKIEISVPTLALPTVVAAEAFVATV